MSLNKSSDFCLGTWKSSAMKVQDKFIYTEIRIPRNSKGHKSIPGYSMYMKYKDMLSDRFVSMELAELSTGPIFLTRPNPTHQKWTRPDFMTHICDPTRPMKCLTRPVPTRHQW